MASEAQKDKQGSTALEAIEDALSHEFSKSENAASELEALEEQLSDVAFEFQNKSWNGPGQNRAPGTSGRAGRVPPDDIDFPTAPPSAANDAHEAEIANFVYAMQQKPKNGLFLWGSVATVVWLFGCAVYGYQNIFVNLETPASLPSLYSNPDALILTPIALLPLLPFWAFLFLIRRSQEMRHAARSMTEAALKLLQPEKFAVQSVASVGGAIRREVAAIGSGVEQAIARAGELETMVQKEVMSLERSYGDSEQRLKRLVEEIAHEREEVINHADRLRSSIQNTQTMFSNELEVAGIKIEEQVKSASEMLTRSIGDQGQVINQFLGQQSTDLVGQLETLSTQITDKLGSGTDMIGHEVAKRAQEISEAIGLSGQTITNLIDTRYTQITAAENEIAAKLESGRFAFDEVVENRKAELNDVLIAAGKSVSGILKSSTAELTEQSNQTIESLETTRQALRNELAQQATEITHAASTAAHLIGDAAKAGAGEFEGRSERIAGQLEESLTMRASDMESRLAEIGERVNVGIIERFNQIESSIAGVGGDLIDSINLRSESLDALLRERAEHFSKIGEEFNASITERIAGIDSTITTSGSNLVSALGMRTEALGNVLRERTDAIGATIASRLTGFGEQMTGHVDHAVEQLGSQANALTNSALAVEQKVLDSSRRIEDVIHEGNINFEKAVENSAEVAVRSKDEIAKQLQQAGEQITEIIVDQSRIFANIVDDKQDKLGQVIEGSMDIMSNSLDEKLTNMASKLNQGAHRIGTALEAKSRDAIDHMESNIRNLESRLKEGNSEIEAHFTAGNKLLENRLSTGKETLLQSIAKSVADAGNTIDSKAGKITELLDSRARSINDTLGTTLVETQRTLENKSDEFNKMLKERSTELRNVLENDAKPLVAAIQETGEEVTQHITGVTKTVVDEANTLFANLSNTTSLLDHLVADSARNLGLVQTGLVDGMDSFSNAVNESTSKMEESQKIAAESEHRLQNVSSSLIESMAQISGNLESQGAVLQDAAKLIDNAQSGFQQTVEEKQLALEQIAQGLLGQTRELNQTMQTFGLTVSNMISDVSDRSQSVSKTVSSEISTAIDDATSRFSDAVDAMRNAAMTMREELEETRAEMRRGVLELPDETAQNASAMRRVVTDQIAALRDLSAIVEKSGRMMDSSSARPQAGLQSAAFASGSTGRPQRERVEAVSANVAPAPQPPRQTPVAQSEPAQQSQSRNEGDSGGWVSDLLRRASQERAPAMSNAAAQPDKRSPHHVVESLNSLSMDIANALDHDTSVDLWERYQRGETNVFTRRLYTLKGQQTFDEISKKFRVEPEFRSAVERYIGDFEQLLKSATQSDPSGMMAQTYLTSDTGKVYTMLAHASGRFGNQR